MREVWIAKEKDYSRKSYLVKENVDFPSFWLDRELPTYADSRFESGEATILRRVREQMLYGRMLVRHAPYQQGRHIHLRSRSKRIDHLTESSSNVGNWDLYPSRVAIRRSVEPVLPNGDDKDAQLVTQWIEKVASAIEKLTIEKSFDSSLQPVLHPQEEDIESIFNELSSQLHQNLRATSSTNEIAMHPLYQQIIGLGKPVVPFLLKGLEEKTGRWFWALKAITREDPVPPEARGRTRIMTEKWLAWGRENGYRW